MAVVNKMKLLVVVLFALEWVACVRLKGDVQTEIQNIKKGLTAVKEIQRSDEEKITENSNQLKNLDSEVSGQEIKINDIKGTQDLTKVTLMAISQMVKGVDARVTDAVKELQDVSKKESEDHEELWKHKEKIQSLEGQSTVVTEKLSQLSKKEETNHNDIRSDKDKISNLDDKLQKLTKKEESDNKELKQKMQSQGEKIQKLTEKEKSDNEEVRTKIQFQEEKIENLTKKEETVNLEVNQLKERIQKEQDDVQSLKSHFKSLTDEVTQLKERGILDKIHPVGSVYITFVNAKAPMDGVHGVKWELLPEGYTIMTGNTGNVGDRSGGSRLDSGYTEGHALTVEEMPSHSHGYQNKWASSARTGGSNMDFDYNFEDDTTKSTGGDQAHYHQLSVRTQKLMIWRRKS